MIYSGIFCLISKNFKQIPQKSWITNNEEYEIMKTEIWQQLNQKEENEICAQANGKKEL